MFLEWYQVLDEFGEQLDGCFSWQDTRPGRRGQASHGLDLRLYGNTETQVGDDDEEAEVGCLPGRGSVGGALSRQARCIGEAWLSSTPRKTIYRAMSNTWSLSIRMRFGTRLKSVLRCLTMPYG